MAQDIACQAGLFVMGIDVLEDAAYIARRGYLSARPGGAPALSTALLPVNA